MYEEECKATGKKPSFTGVNAFKRSPLMVEFLAKCRMWRWKPTKKAFLGFLATHPLRRNWEKRGQLNEPA